MIYELNSFFVKMLLFWEEKIDLSTLKKYLGEYASIEKINNISETYDLSVFFIDEENKLFEKNVYVIDNYRIKLINKKLFIGRKKSDNNEILFMKRLLIDLINRFFEKKGGIFLHSSSIVYKENSVLFIGEKGAGKTTNMLYMLNNNEFSYSSNERTGLILKKGEIITYGNPARINIRANTLKLNTLLRNKLMNSLDKSKYKEYVHANLPRDCSERLVIGFDELANKLDVKVIPSAKAKMIFNLIYNPNVKFAFEEVNFDCIKPYIEKSIIDGVFPKRKKLNDIILLDNPSTIDILNSNEILYYNIFQNGTQDISNEICRILKRKL